MAQRTKPKLSSRGAVLLRRLMSGKCTLADLTDVTALEEAMAVITYPVRRAVLVDLANARGEKGAEWFWRKWAVQFRPETMKDLVELGNDLRKLWAFFDAETPHTEEMFTLGLLNKWLAWRPQSEQLQAYLNWRRDEDAEQVLGISGGMCDYTPFWCSIFSGKLIPDPNCLRAMLIQGVFEHWRHFCYCANADCQTPFFIAKRIDQTICDAEVCKAEKQRQHALKWWRANRAKLNAGSEQGNSKRTKKGTAKNVSQKAR